MSESTEPDNSKALAVQTEIRVVTSAIEVSLGVKELTQDFSIRRDAAIAAGGKFIKPPEDDDQQLLIQSAKHDISKLRTDLTKNGDALKAPLNAARDKIIELVKTATATLKREEDRLNGLVNHRQQKLIEARREAEAAAAREAKRIADDAAAAQRSTEAAESARRVAELAAQQAEALRGQAKLQAEQEAARLAQEAARMEDEAFAQALAAEAPVAVVAVPISELPMAREVIDFTLAGNNDIERKASLIKLLVAHDELFTFKSDEAHRGASLTLRIQDLTERLNSKPPAPPITEAPGINIIKTLSKLR